MKSESKTCLSIHQASFRSASCSGIRSTTKIESTSAVQTFSHFGKPLSLSPLHECDSSPEPSNRWVERLRHNPSDSVPFASKRLKTRDDLYRVQARNLLDDACSYEESKAVNNWIRRRCCGSRQAAPLQKLAPPVLCEPERSNTIHKTLEEKQLPSIAAMALMEAAAKNSHLSRFRKKGALLIWNIEG